MQSRSEGPLQLHLLKVPWSGTTVSWINCSSSILHQTQVPFSLFVRPFRGYLSFIYSEAMHCLLRVTSQLRLHELAFRLSKKHLNNFLCSVGGSFTSTAKKTLIIFLDIPLQSLRLCVSYKDITKWYGKVAAFYILQHSFPITDCVCVYTCTALFCI